MRPQHLAPLRVLQTGQDFFREVGEDLFYMTVNYKRPSWELHIWAGKLQSLTPEMHTLDVI